MSREARNIGILGLIATTLLAAKASSMQSPATIQDLDDLVTLSPPQLDQLYRQSGPGPMPTGKVRGRALYPESRFPRARSNAAKFAWQGKVFDPETSTAINRFFGVKAIRGNVYVAPSWLDGNPSMILDYEGTSKIYGNYRDEIREVAPGLYLGLMYDRTTCPVSLKMYFAFDAR
jgi:hypothetical protein